MSRSVGVGAFAVAATLAAGRTAAGQDQVSQLPARVPYASLTVDQRTMVERGGVVQLLEALTTSPWPRSVVFEFIDATPEECAAVLSDFELQSKYIPRMKTSRIVQRRGAVETDVQYVIDVPIYPDEQSVSRQQVRAINGEYSVRWQTVVSDTDPPKSVTTGQALFAAMTNPKSGKQGTLMVHDQTVLPNSVFARIPYIRNKAIETSRDAAKAITRQIEMERSTDPRLLQRQVARLREALASRPDSVHLRE